MYLTKRDVISSIVTGLTTGIIVSQIARFLGHDYIVGIPVVALVAIVPIAWLVGVWLGYFLGDYVHKGFISFGRFVAVGFTNAAVDFGIFYLLIGLTGEDKGLKVSLFKACSFSVALIHSYFWNKYWAFNSGKNSKQSTFVSFVVVSLVALGVNVGVTTLVVSAMHPLFGVSQAAWDGVAAAVGSAAALLFSFFGYRIFVFK